uniref:ATP-binding protein n=1 Tax=Ignisphaera aggregans TaxID=334771 RepID=A0A7J3Z675_9CREN
MEERNLFTLKIRSLGPIDLRGAEVLLHIGKTILYGPNGGGKTAIIRALIYMIAGEGGKRDRLLYELEAIENYARIFGKTDTELCIHSGKVKDSEGVDCAELKCDELTCRAKEVVWPKRYELARIAGDVFYSTREAQKIDIIHNQGDLKNVLSEPLFIERVEEFLYYHGSKITRFHGDYFKELVNGESRWAPIIALPYGIKKAILILYALENHDIVLIEGFEAGLHLDLMRGLLDYVDDIYRDRIVVIETHSGLPIRWGIDRGWSVYYVDRSAIEVLRSREELLQKATLFKREVEALSL